LDFKYERARCNLNKKSLTIIATTTRSLTLENVHHHTNTHWRLTREAKDDEEEEVEV